MKNNVIHVLVTATTCGSSQYNYSFQMQPLVISEGWDHDPTGSVTT